MENINKFESWFNKINEDLGQDSSATISDVQQTQSDVTTSTTSSRDTMIDDIDTIMNSLETLASELTEELTIELDLNEGASDFIKSWFISRKAVKAQSKVNKIKMNAAALDYAAANLEGDKKDKAKSKAEKVHTQAKDLQTMIDNKYKGKGAIVDRKLAQAKIEGQMELIKSTSGMEDNPRKKSDLSSRLKELDVKLKKEAQAVKELEGENKEEIAQHVEDKNESLSQTTLQESLINRAVSIGLSELAKEIETKHNWQVAEGTVLASKYNKIITKSESDNILLESKLEINSIKDAFSRLM